MEELIHVELLHDRHLYTDLQLHAAIRITYAIDRGKLLLCEPPVRTRQP